MLGEFATEVWVALAHGDIPPLAFVGGRVARLVGEVVFLHFLSHVLERVVSNFF
jgi:hypothetical protein